MGQVGVNKSHWDSAAGSAARALSSVNKATVRSLGKTNLTRFKDWHTLQEDINKSLSKFKSYAESETAKMKKASALFEQEDDHVAKQFTKARFK